MTTTHPGIQAPTPPAIDGPTVVIRPVASQRLYAVDVLRFAAASAVVAFHVVPMVGFVFGVDVDSYLGHTVVQASRYGWMGVPCFFVISGFVICMSSWGRTVSEFATSRTVRLLPAYVAAVLVAAVILWLSPTPGFDRPTVVQVLTNLTMLQGLAGVPNLDTVYWTLLVELKFYLIFAVVVAFGVTYRRVVAFCGSWLVGGLIAQVAGSRLLTTLLEPQWTPLFVVGIVLYLMHRFGPTALLWLMLSVAVALSSHSIDLATAGYAATSPINTPVALAVFAVFLVAMLAVTRGWAGWARWRGLATIGALTYPLYLLHFHVVFLALRVGHGVLPDWLLLVAALVGVLALSYVVWRLVERPGARGLRRGLRRGFAELADARH